MRFQFDPRKAATSLKKHGVSFVDVEGVFSDPLAIHREDPDTEDEERFIAVGMGSAGGILVVIYTLRGDEIPLISARRATRNEVKDYER
ncbi:MAG: BrnT family toxin [Gammaproteobacteria bacterium]|nr:BrnT family toxin [Gammaproteobacteria bacterium]